MQFLHDLNRHLRDRRVPRKAAAVFTACTLREISALIACSNGTISLDKDYALKVDKRRYQEIADNLKIMGLSPNSAGRVLAMVSYELKLKSDVEHEALDYATAEYLTEEIRTSMVERGVLDGQAFSNGIAEKYGVAA